MCPAFRSLLWVSIKRVVVVAAAAAAAVLLLFLCCNKIVLNWLGFGDFATVPDLVRAL